MNPAVAFYREVVFGGHLLALGTASIAASCAWVAGESPSWDLLLMAYLFTFGAYTVNRWSDFEEDKVSHPERTSYLAPRRKALPAIAGVAFAAGYTLASLRNLPFLAGLVAPLVLAVAYSVGSKRMGQMLGIRRLKEGLFVKNVAVAFSWSLIPILVGLYYLRFPESLIAISPFVFMRLMVNTVFFDVRDIDADSRYGVKTIPSELGLGPSWRIMDVIDGASAVYIVALALSGIIPLFGGLLAAFAPYSLAYRYYARRHAGHGDTLRDLAADGEYVMWGVVTYLGQI